MILPLLISLLQDGAIASCFATLKKAERKLQLRLHTYQEGEFLAGVAVVFGSEHPHKTETCFKAEKKNDNNIVLPPLSLCSFTLRDALVNLG